MNAIVIACGEVSAFAAYRLCSSLVYPRAYSKHKWLRRVFDTTMHWSTATQFRQKVHQRTIVQVVRTKSRWIVRLYTLLIINNQYFLIAGLPVLDFVNTDFQVINGIGFIALYLKSASGQRFHSQEHMRKRGRIVDSRSVVGMIHVRDMIRECTDRPKMYLFGTTINFECTKSIFLHTNGVDRYELAVDNGPLLSGICSKVDILNRRNPWRLGWVHSTMLSPSQSFWL